MLLIFKYKFFLKKKYSIKEALDYIKRVVHLTQKDARLKMGSGPSILLTGTRLGPWFSLSTTYTFPFLPSLSLRFLARLLAFLFFLHDFLTLDSRYLFFSL